MPLALTLTRIVTLILTLIVHCGQVSHEQVSYGHLSDEQLSSGQVAVTQNSAFHQTSKKGSGGFKKHPLTFKSLKIESLKFRLKP